MAKLVDEKGFMLEGTNLLLYWPGFNGILCYHVIYRHNRHFEDLTYGPLPYTASGHEAGVVPANSTTDEYKFNWYWDNRRRGHQKENMFYFEKSDRLIHTFMTVKPFMLRNYIHYPETMTLLTYLAGYRQARRRGLLRILQGELRAGVHPLPGVHLRDLQQDQHRPQDLCELQVCGV